MSLSPETTKNWSDFLVFTGHLLEGLFSQNLGLRQLRTTTTPDDDKPGHIFSPELSPRAGVKARRFQKCPGLSPAAGVNLGHFTPLIIFHLTVPPTYLHLSLG
jgi:hypothetical protein